MNRLEQSKQTIRAAKYIQHGLKTNLIALDTNLPVKYVRDLIRDITGKSPTSGQLVEVPRLFKSKRSIMASVLLLVTYQKIAPKQNNATVNLDALIMAFDCYCKQTSGLLGFESNQCGNPLSINDAWVLANALSTEQIELSFCRCGCVVIIADKLDTYMNCPFCYHLGKLKLRS